MDIDILQCGCEILCVWMADCDVVCDRNDYGDVLEELSGGDVATFAVSSMVHVCGVS